MSAEVNPLNLAKVNWEDPQTGATCELVLAEGATVTIGRLDTNDICIKEQHVSRQHAVISYRDGLFTIADLGSANGTFVNDQKIESAFPLASGDIIRLYVPILRFSAVLGTDDQRVSDEKGTTITAVPSAGKGRLIITNEEQKGETIPLLLNKIMIGRATSNATWQICLQDASVSRPHARLELGENNTWVIYDLNSANGTFVNGTPVGEKGRELRDGDEITLGATTALFRVG